MYSFAESKICIAVDGSEYFWADVAHSHTHTYVMKYAWIPDVMHVTSRYAISVHLISRKSNSIISNPHTAVFARSRPLTAAMIRSYFFSSTNKVVHTNIFPPHAFFLFPLSHAFNKVFISILQQIRFFPFRICISFSFTL